MIQRLLAHFATMAAATNAPAWAYDKTQVMLKLDGDEKVEEQTEKLYRVRIIHGVPFSRLVKVAGHDLTPAEIEKQNQREAAFEKGLSGRDPKKALAERQAFVTNDVIERFQFTALRRETRSGRQTVVVSFEGNPDKAGGTFQDRLLSLMAGTCWVDEETADLAKLDVHLTKGLSLGMLGILGTIRNCQMEMESKPMSDGVWLPAKTEMTVSARMLLSSMRFKMEETSANYTLESAAKTASP